MLIQADTTRKHPDAFLHRGVARFMVRDVEGARADWQKFLELAPSSPNAGPVKLQLETLGRRPAQTAAPAAAAEAPSIAQAMLAPEPEPEREPEFRLMGEAWVPGGRKALAAIKAAATTKADLIMELLLNLSSV